MKIIIFISLLSLASANTFDTIWYFNTENTHSVCVNKVHQGNIYNHRATEAACELYAKNSCPDCVVTKDEAKSNSYCHSPSKKIISKNFKPYCKESGADKALSS
ncbi:hypothetical protein K3495_g8218 [Podosphaera aphanis]|nr:hypothetical protein K3495_g8218 [Podosphaera aphanis]